MAKKKYSQDELDEMFRQLDGQEVSPEELARREREKSAKEAKEKKSNND